jgi:VWFA-related protein
MRSGLRFSLAGALVVGTLLVAGNLAAQQSGAQFRSATDIVAIDFLAARPDGQPVTDLTAKEITVRVDGRVREIKSFQFVKLSAATRERASFAPVLPLPFATNDGPVPGRSVIIVVDHEQIGPQEGKNAFDAASRFLDQLTPIDRAALVTMPNGKVESDLTANHDRVRDALRQVVGRRPQSTGAAGLSNISVEEALTVLYEKDDPDKMMTKELLERECKYAPE